MGLAPVASRFLSYLKSKDILMEPLSVNYAAIGVGAVLSMVLGTIWYGPLFGKRWSKIIGATTDDLEARKKMQREAGPLYVVQFVLTLFQVLVLAHLVADTLRAGGLERSLWIWAADRWRRRSGRAPTPVRTQCSRTGFCRNVLWPRKCA